MTLSQSAHPLEKKMKKEELLKLYDNNLNLIERYSEEPLKVLDHGHVRLIDLMGQDQAIVQAARVSYGLGQSTHKAIHRLVPGGGGRMEQVCEICLKAMDGTNEAPAHDAAGDVRDQAPREDADLRGQAVDPPPDGQRQRVQYALLAGD